MVDLRTYRAAKRASDGESDRNELNQLLTERIVERRWERGSQQLQPIQRAIAASSQGPAFHPERARALVPTLLEVVDEMDESEREEREWERINGPISTGRPLISTGETPA